MSSPIEEKIEQLGHRLPAAPEAVGFYVPVLRTGNLVVTSGQLPFMGKELVFKGKVGSEIHEDDGINAARICVLNALAQIKACVGDLEQVTRIVKLEGFVQSAPSFRNQPHVLNGASQFLVDVFGEKGKHTRTAIGVSEMPLNAAVQIALWAEVG